MTEEIRIIQKNNLPKRLRQIPDPPERLYLRGVLPDEDKNRFLCVVGSRRFSRYGREACEYLIAGLTGQPIVIVSGLALGIDSIAHEAALRSGLKTVSVIGSGLNDAVLYPRSNRGLANKILEKGGGLISEFEPAHKARIEDFPCRNRIMAGLSDALLVIEAAEKSGTLITARLAMDYNREVLAVPGSIFAPTSAGVQFLLRNGAAPVRSAEDILDGLGLHPDQTQSVASAEKETAARWTDCSPEEQKLLKILATPLPRDEIIRASRASASQVNTLLTILEIKGLVVERLGAIYRL